MKKGMAVFCRPFFVAMKKIAIPAVEPGPEVAERYQKMVGYLVYQMRQYFPKIIIPNVHLARDDADFQRVTGINPREGQVFAVTVKGQVPPTIVFSTDHQRTMGAAQGRINATNDAEVLAWKAMAHELVHVGVFSSGRYREMDVLDESLAELWALTFTASLPHEGSDQTLVDSLIRTRFYAKRIPWVAELIIAITGGKDVFGYITGLLNDTSGQRVREVEAALGTMDRRLSLRKVQEIISTKPDNYDQELTELWQTVDRKSAAVTSNPLAFIMQRSGSMNPMQQLMQLLQQAIQILQSMSGSSQWGEMGRPSQWGEMGRSSQWGEMGRPSQWGEMGRPSQWGEMGMAGNRFTAAISLTEPTEPVEVEGKKFDKGEVLLFQNVAVAKAEENANGDVISLENISELVASLPLKPISIEHEDGSMAGVFVSAKQDGDFAKVDGLVYVKHVPSDAITDLRAGRRALSVEAVAEKAACSVCNQEFADQSAYCNHLKAKKTSGAKRILKGMRGTGGAIVKDPAASGTQIPSNTISFIASQIISREVSTEEREKLAEKGQAMADGSFPIANEGDLANAIKAVGRAKDYDAAKRHIMKRAREMGKESMLPEDWVKGVVEQVQASLLAAIKALQEQSQARTEQLSTEVKQARVFARKIKLVESGLLTEEEWKTHETDLTNTPDGVVTLFASKMTEKPKLRLGGSVVNAQQSVAAKPKLVIG